MLQKHNCITATETVTCIIAAERSTNITLAESTINIMATEPQNCIIARDIGTCIIAIQKVSCIVPTDTATCRIDHRNFHLQKWCQPKILSVVIKKLSEKVSSKFKAKQFQYYLYNSMKKLGRALCQWNCAIYSLFQFSYLHAFYKPNNITIKLSFYKVSYHCFKIVR